jgi:hypothetical protein
LNSLKIGKKLKVSKVKNYFSNGEKLNSSAEKRFYLLSKLFKCFNISFLLKILAGPSLPKWRVTFERNVSNLLQQKKNLRKITLEVATNNHEKNLGWNLENDPEKIFYVRVDLFSRTSTLFIC